MSSLQSLKKRLRNIRSTLSLTEAMKTAATVKYAKVSKRRDEFSEYYNACNGALSIISDHAFERLVPDVKKRNCYVLISSNRGFCGGFNNELFKFFDAEVAMEKTEPVIILCGKKAVSRYGQKYPDAEVIQIEDVSPYSDAQQISEKILELYLNGECTNVYIVSQKFRNMMTQIPTKYCMLPYTSEKYDNSKSFMMMPDAFVLGNQPAVLCFTGNIYGILLSHESSCQAATMIAMKSACDNAKESADALEVKINRTRQTEVTNSVIETASSNVTGMEI